MNIQMNSQSQKNKNKSKKELSDAFDMFNSAISGLGSSYKALTDQIQDFDFELSDKNQRLQDNLYEVNRLRRFLDSILHNMSDAVIVINTDGEIVLFNGSAEKLTGYTRDEVSGKRYVDIFGEKISERFSPLYTLHQKKMLYMEEKAIKRKSGETIPVRYSTSLVTDNLDRIVGVVEVLSDLTLVKRLESEMQRIKTQTALNQMAGLVAHEIRTPLGGVRGYVDLLSESLEKDDKCQEMLSNIVTSVQRLEKTVSNFQMFSKPVKPQFGETDIIRYLTEVFDYFKKSNSLTDKGIRFSFTVQSKVESLPVRLDPMLFEQALLAVLDNAVKSMEKGGTVRAVLQTERSGISSGNQSQISLEISDTGSGMTKDVIDKLFTPFFTTREHGTGLGLALAKNFMKIHHGDIYIESQPAEGTIVTIILPV